MSDVPEGFAFSDMSHREIPIFNVKIYNYFVLSSDTK